MSILYISTVTECPSGVPVVQCFADPCSVTQCPKYPDATCNADYCGGCNARFYDNNIEITDQCTGKLIIIFVVCDSFIESMFLLNSCYHHYVPENEYVHFLY